MRRTENGRAVLMELTVMLLFTALTACVALSLFYESRADAVLSGQKADALILAQACAERVMAGDEALRATKGVARWTEGDYTVELTLAQETDELGVLYTGVVSVSAGDETLVTLPCGKYEAAP